MPTTDSDFISSIPKTELHVHLEASLRLETFLEMHKLSSDDQELQEDVESGRIIGYKSIAEFFDVWKRVNKLLRSAEDFARITAEYLEDCAAQNCLYVELNLNMLRQLSKGLEPREVLEAVFSAQKELEQKTGVVSRTLLSISRDWPEKDAFSVLEIAAKFQGKNVAGIDISGNEHNRPNSHYQSVFRQAYRKGIKATAHAGENVSGSSVWSAVNEIGVSRIGHGLDAACDERLIALLLKTQTAVELCPTSNLKLGHVAVMSEHPGLILIERGVACTFNTDDPLLFGTTLNDEYQKVTEAWQLNLDQVLDAGRNGIRFAFINDGLRKELLQEFERRSKKLKSNFGAIGDFHPAFRRAEFY
jgi:adenosine deaminase